MTATPDSAPARPYTTAGEDFVEFVRDHHIGHHNWIEMSRALVSTGRGERWADAIQEMAILHLARRLISAGVEIVSSRLEWDMVAQRDIKQMIVDTMVIDYFLVNDVYVRLERAIAAARSAISPGVRKQLKAESQRDSPWCYLCGSELDYTARHAPAPVSCLAAPRRAWTQWGPARRADRSTREPAMEPAVDAPDADGRSWRTYKTIEETSEAYGQGAVWVFKGADGRVTARERAAQFAATFQMTNACTLDAEEDPILPPASTAAERLNPPASGPPPLDPPPTAKADALAMFRPSPAVPAEYQPGGGLARGSKPQVCAVVWASGVEVKARDIRAHQPTIGDEAALQGAARLLCLHETFHSYVAQAVLRFQTLTGREPVTSRESKEEALANAFAARNVDEPLAAAQAAIAEEGDLAGYSELAKYLRDADFSDGLLDLGRTYFGDEYAHLILDVVERDDAFDTAIAVGLPGDQRRSAYQSGAWSVDPRDYNQVIDEPLL